MVFLKTAFRRVATTSVVTASVALGPIFTAIAAVTLNGAGATFPQPFMSGILLKLNKNFQTC
jgi:phosphate transport system substrate-binding protein